MYIAVISDESGKTRVVRSEPRINNSLPLSDFLTRIKTCVKSDFDFESNPYHPENSFSVTDVRYCEFFGISILFYKMCLYGDDGNGFSETQIDTILKEEK